MTGYLKAFTEKGQHSHLMEDGADKTLCGIRIERIAHLEPTGDEPGCKICFNHMERER